MFEKLHDLLFRQSQAAAIIISVAIMLIAGFLLTRITKKLRLPNVTAYIVAGIIIGRFGLNLIPEQVVSGSGFLADIALAFIAFSTGEFFKLSAIKANSFKVVVITVFEAFAASASVFILTYCVLGINIAFSVVLAALASATAPASTMMTIRQTGAKGDFVNTLLQVVALDDIIGLVAYSCAISIALASLSGVGVKVSSVAIPLLKNLGVLIIGGLFGLILNLMLKFKHSTDNRLIISVSLLFAFCGICTMVDVSPLLGCMSMGTVYINMSDDKELFKQLNYFNPPILLLFFVRSGLCFDLNALIKPSGVVGRYPLMVIGVLYFIVRIAGKYLGVFVGSVITKKDKKVRNYLGLTLIPQAGIAIGLAALGARALGGEMGNSLQTIILASSVLYELTGPGCAKLALYLSGSYSTKLEDITEVEELNEDKKQKTQLELLIERINKIQEQLPANEVNEEEQAFAQAAAENYEAINKNIRFQRFHRR